MYADEERLNMEFWLAMMWDGTNPVDWLWENGCQVGDPKNPALTVVPAQANGLGERPTSVLKTGTDRLS